MNRAKILKEREKQCPCFRDGLGCELNHCFCLKCQNPFSQVEAMQTGEKKKETRKRKLHSSYKRTRGEHYLKINNCQASQGSWTKLETCMLETIESLLASLSNIPGTAENIEKLYNFVASSEKVAELFLYLRPKTLNQIRAKIVQVSKTKEAFLNLFYPCL